MKKITRIISVLLLVLTCVFTSCKKEEDPGTGQVDFTLNLQEAQSTLKSTSSIATASFVMITIEDSKGKIVKNAEKLELYTMSGNFITQPLSLVSGSYKLTQFLVLDNNNNVLYASPLKGSGKAYLVQQSLPVAFDAQKDAVTKLVPEVVSASENTPESFGYATFNFSVTETFDFLVGAFIYNESVKNYQLTTATISVLNGTNTVYKGQLNAKSSSTNVTVYDSVGVTNKITLPATYSDYTVVIDKPGYKTYSKKFTKEELKLYFRSADKGPLVVILEAGAVPVEETGFYIRANIGNEYVNCTTLRINNYVYSYTTPVSCNLHFIGYEGDTISWCRTLSMFASSSVGSITTLPAPFAIPSTDRKVYGEIQFSTGNANPKFGPNDNVNYLGVASEEVYDYLVLEVTSNENHIMSGKFHGKIRTMTGLILPVTNGEFRGKIKDVIF